MQREALKNEVSVAFLDQLDEMITTLIGRAEAAPEEEEEEEDAPGPATPPAPTPSSGVVVEGADRGASQVNPAPTPAEPWRTKSKGLREFVSSRRGNNPEAPVVKPPVLTHPSHGRCTETGGFVRVGVPSTFWVEQPQEVEEDPRPQPDWRKQREDLRAHIAGLREAKKVEEDWCMVDTCACDPEGIMDFVAVSPRGGSTREVIA